MYRQSNIFINVTASDNPATTVFVTPRAAADCILVTFGTIDPVVAVPVLSPLSTGRQPSPPSPPIVLVYCRGATSFHVVGEGRADECLLPCSCRGWRLLAGAVTICRHRCRGGACLVLFHPWSRILEIYISTLPDVPYRLLWLIPTFPNWKNV